MKQIALLSTAALLLILTIGCNGKPGANTSSAENVSSASDTTLVDSTKVDTTKVDSVKVDSAKLIKKLPVDSVN